MQRHFFPTLHPLSLVFFATATVLAFVLLRNSRFNFHCYTQREAMPTQKSAWMWRCNFLRKRLQRAFTRANKPHWTTQYTEMDFFITFQTCYLHTHCVHRFLFKPLAHFQTLLLIKTSCLDCIQPAACCICCTVSCVSQDCQNLLIKTSCLDCIQPAACCICCPVSCVLQDCQNLLIKTSCLDCIQPAACCICCTVSCVSQDCQNLLKQGKHCKLLKLT